MSVINLNQQRAKRNEAGRMPKTLWSPGRGVNPAWRIWKKHSGVHQILKPRSADDRGFQEYKAYSESNVDQDRLSRIRASLGKVDNQDRLSRIRASLGKVDKLMRELEELKQKDRMAALED
jgi:hypothetical protein